MPPKRKQECQFDGDDSPRKKKKLWDEEEVAALWKAIYDVAKISIPHFAQLPILKQNGRSTANLHGKLDGLFKPLLKK